VFNLLAGIVDDKKPGSSIEVIYVCSSQIPEDVIRYYYKILQLLGVQNPRKKVHFLVPE